MYQMIKFLVSIFLIQYCYSYILVNKTFLIVKMTLNNTIRTCYFNEKEFALMKPKYASQ